MTVELIIRIVITVIVIGVLAVILIRSFRGKTNPNARDSLDIMKERMERGEVSKEAYEEMKKRRGKD